MLVEVFTFDGCPHGEPAVGLARQVLAETGIEAVIRVVFVGSAESQSLRFLGSPSIRVDGRDIEPGAERRRDYGHCCRLYATPAGQVTLPDANWLHEALIAGTPTARLDNDG